jgi:hypothetical protein
MTLSVNGSSRLTQFLLAALAAGVWGLLLRPYLPAAQAATEQSAAFDTLNVQRLNIVDPDGTLRLIIANRARLPGAIIRGKTYPRSIDNAAGMVFLDTRGEETGGLVAAKLRDTDVANLTFDYTYQLTDGIRMWKQESADGANWRAGFDILDRRPYTGRVESSQGVPRIGLADENQNAALVISDVQGHARIRIGVSRAGEPSIEMLSADGKVTYRAGEK